MTCCPTCKRPFEFPAQRGLTRPQYKALQFIKTFTAEHGYAPTLQEIAHGIGIVSRGYVSKVIDGLIERGAVSKFPNAQRSIVVLEPPALRGAA